MSREVKKIPELFGSCVFNERTMRKYVKEKYFQEWKKCLSDGKPLTLEVADGIAEGMKQWALENGATHFTHWFQPLTGITAEKHDSFISPKPGGKVIMEFSGKELIQGEPDASSFPSGGLRATFEARGYTAWDATSYAFIKDGVLCIPTVFLSYGGEALDQKTALLRSMEAINRQALRVLKLFGNPDVASVKTTVGPEQEYFLVDKADYDKRKDLIYTGRTLFGAKPPKGQELDDHYFGAIKPRVAAFMKDLNDELWKLGILAKTEHNEVAPAQHELAPIFTTTNIAADHNQLTMEMMQKVAKRHNLVCLLHEKPFDGVNGSGKHNNWSLSTDTGKNLFSPGKTPRQNAQFLVFLAAFIQGIDEYQEFLRCTVASASNDTRLGANEAPPAIVSMFLGSDLSEILEAIEKDVPYDGKEKQVMRIGVHTLPKFQRDATDRNRTSPFAFTGNKFEFRMLGSSESISCANTVLNTSVAEELRQFADVLEETEDFEVTLHELIRKTIAEHKRIIFNGDGYTTGWLEEAAKRGLPNAPTTPEALKAFTRKENVEVFEKAGVFTEREMKSRYEIAMEDYTAKVEIEGNTALEIARTQILPAVRAEYLETLKAYNETDASDVKVAIDALHDETAALGKGLVELRAGIKALQEAVAAADPAAVLAKMGALRTVADGLETVVSDARWPLPKYRTMLFLY